MIAGCFLSPTCWLTGLAASPLFSPTFLEFWSRFNQEEGEKHGRLSLADRCQLLRSIFSLYITERVPATLRYGWINFSSLSLLLLLSLCLLVSLDLSFSLAFSNCLCLPLSVCLSVLLPESFLLLA